VKCFLVNRRRDPANPHKGIEVQYDFGGNTKRLPPDARVEVGFDEGQLALTKLGAVGVSLEYEK
jgi:hypothetical protein